MNYETNIHFTNEKALEILEGAMTSTREALKLDEKSFNKMEYVASGSGHLQFFFTITGDANDMKSFLCKYHIFSMYRVLMKKTVDRFLFKAVNLSESDLQGISYDNVNPENVEFVATINESSKGNLEFRISATRHSKDSINFLICSFNFLSGYTDGKGDLGLRSKAKRDMINKQIMKQSKGVVKSEEDKLAIAILHEIKPEDIDVCFADIAGIDNAKSELTEVIDFLKNPERYNEFGAVMPKGTLLSGSPGTGKTMLAKAVAKEAGVPFFYTSGSEFVQMFVGVGASRVRTLFDEATKRGKAIIFIDEFDALASKRTSGGGGSDEYNQTKNAFLVAMDGFKSSSGVIVLAATNRPELLDEAALRPGRFDRQIVVHRPDCAGRLKVLQVHAAKREKMSPDVDLDIIARSTPGMSPAALANLINEAAINAVRRSGATAIEMIDLKEAKNRVVMGISNSDRIIPKEDLKITAYHEVGHAVTGALMENHKNPLNQITIIPRGQAAGVTSFLESEIQHSSRESLMAELVCFYGGRAAEEVMLGSICTGAVSDITVATNIAYKMVTEFGMSEKFGPVALVDKVDSLSGAHVDGHLSDETLTDIDHEVRKILDDAYENAKKIIEGNKSSIELIVKRLCEIETMDAEEFFKILLNNCKKEDRKIIQKKAEMAKSVTM